MASQPTVRLRDYQVEAILAVRSAWAGGIRRPAIVIPTGGGKTVIFSSLIKQELERDPDAGPIVVIAHRDELITQFIEKLAAVAPGVTVGIVKARQNELDRQVIACSVQSLSPKRAAQVAARKPRLVIVDEAHHYSSETYRAALAGLGCFDADGPLSLGVSATLARSDDQHLALVWEKVVYEIDIEFMVENGYLVRPLGRRMKLKGLDLSGVKKTAGDFNEGQLGQALSGAAAPEQIAKIYKELAGDRKGMVFQVNVELSKRQAEALSALGIPAEHADGTMGREERAAIIGRLRSGTTQVICNCAIWTEGFDCPDISAVVIRPTLSRTLYQQMAGRGLRPAPGKDDCLILDPEVKTKHNLASVTDLGLDSIEVDQDVVHDVTGRCLGMILIILRRYGGSAMALPLAKLGRYLRKEWHEKIDDAVERGIKDGTLQVLSGWVQRLLDATGEEDAEPAGGMGAREIELLDIHAVEEFQFFEAKRERPEKAAGWRQTAAGVWFAPAGGDGLVVLLRGHKPGRYAVALYDKHRRTGDVRLEDASLKEAFAFGSTLHRDGVPAQLRRSSSPWRREAPTAGQLRLARSLGLSFDPTEAAGPLSDRIDIAVASQALDHLNLAQDIKQNGYWG